MDLTYRLLNVFTDPSDPFSGNCVCVFEDGSSLDSDRMQALAEQVNTETVFVLPSKDDSDASVRFFSPEKETGFAGSASLATAAVLRDLEGGEGDVRLHEQHHGDYTVHQRDGLWILPARAATTTKLDASAQILASLVGLGMDAIDGEVMRVDSGRSGIVLPVRSVDDVRKTRLDARLLHSYAMLLNTEPQVYVWAHAQDEPDTIVSRMFYGPRGGVLEVAATGTGGANLGAWLAAHGEKDIHKKVIQGSPSSRPSILDLRVDDGGKVYIGGKVHQIAKGTFTV